MIKTNPRQNLNAFSSFIRRRCAIIAMTGLMIVGGAVVMNGLVHAQRKSEPEPAAGRQLWREGSRVEMVGTFHGGGADPITFRPQNRDQSYGVLENLALQRVAKILQLSTKRNWQITAEATEFDNANYLLLKRVVVKGKSQALPPKKAATSENK